MRFFLGTHHPAWLARTDVPLFVSHHRLAGRRTLPGCTTHINCANCLRYALRWRSQVLSNLPTWHQPVLAA